MDLKNLEVKKNKEKGEKRVEKMRKKMEEIGMEGFIVKREDENKGEYVNKKEKSIGWMKGLKG